MVLISLDIILEIEFDALYFLTDNSYSKRYR